MMNVLCKWFCDTNETDESVAKLRAVLRQDCVGIISARCCAPMAAEHDDALKANVEAAMKMCSRDDNWALISITEAQKALKGAGGELQPAEQRLVAQIQMLVSTQGFSIFPILVINRKVAFYGGLPTVAMIADNLSSTVALS